MPDLPPLPEPGYGPVRALYEAELRARGYQSDPAQLRAVEALERLSLIHI